MASTKHINRRSILKAAPAAVVTAVAPIALGAMPVEDPVLPVYRRWRDNHEAWLEILERPENRRMDSDDIPGANALHDARERAFSELLGMTPTSLEGVAAISHVLWVEDGPSYVEGHPDHVEEMKAPEMKLKAAMWRAISGPEGLLRATA